jgi:hypothetical protein
MSGILLGVEIAAGLFLFILAVRVALRISQTSETGLRLPKSHLLEKANAARQRQRKSCYRRQTGADTTCCRIAGRLAR